MRPEIFIDMKLTKWLQRKNIPPLHFVSGDSLTISVKGTDLLTEHFDRQGTIDEVGLFESVIDGQAAFGGVFIEPDKTRGNP